ncbi:MAG TPA: HD domain-containing phosphohydrolase [Bryobacteraceae bacterium]|jgi:putative nucleotidyltransferase with HDIG domain|nr:HD domain-containing phosphohydrolase [Bryobacteraceae bacterium]
MTPPRATVYIGLIILAGSLILGHGLWNWSSQDWTRYLTYCVIALLASGMKVTLPAVSGTMSMNFVFVLIGISELSLPETLVMGCLGMLVQSVVYVKNRLRAVQVIFNVASMACSIQVSYSVYHAAFRDSGALEAPIKLLLAGATFFVTNTLSIATVIGLTEKRQPWKIWRESYFWSFPNYLVGAAAAWIVGVASALLGWQTSLLLLPIVYVIYRSHSLYVNRLEDEKKRAEEQRQHAEEVVALHRRTIEVLALAIEAKDQTTHDHLERVEVYAIAVGQELGLDEGELEALRASALLHDIGKLAVPEYIISKPGKLTPEEFEKMKTHTVVGAEIVEQIRFPYPVAPIVRSHHEKWDGTGYPDGLSGEQIPVGARILSAVDCLDALASDRQYRRALPLDEAIKIVEGEAGKAFDPRVVAILARRYIELEHRATSSHSHEKAKLSTDLKIARGDAPAAGFESTGSDLVKFHRAIAAEDLLAGCSDRQAAFPMLHASVRNLVPYDVLVLYRKSGEHLTPESLDGEDYRLFGSLEIPLGMGLSGWVAENAKSIINGNPSVEPGYLNDPTKFSTLRSALAVPLQEQGAVVGVLSLYRLQRDAFTNDDLASILSVGPAAVRALSLPARETSSIA